MILDIYAYVPHATVETAQMLDHSGRQNVFEKLDELYEPATSNLCHSQEHGSSPPLYSSGSDPALSFSKAVTRPPPRSAGLHPVKSPQEASSPPTHPSCYTEPLRALPADRKPQPPIGTPRHSLYSGTRHSLRNATYPERLVGSGCERTYTDDQAPSVVTISSPPLLPPTSVLGRYQAQSRLMLPDVKRRLAIGVGHNGCTFTDSTGRRHRADFARNHGEVLSRPLATRHSDLGLESPDDMPGKDGFVAQTCRDGRATPHRVHVQVPSSLVPRQGAPIMPLDEERLLSRISHGTARRHTQDLDSQEEVLLVPPTRRSVYPASPSDAIIPSSQRKYDHEARSYVQSPPPSNSNWSSTGRRPFRRHPIPISSHNPFRHPSQYAGRTQPAGTDAPPVPVQLTQRDRGPLRSHRDIRAPQPRVVKPDMVRYLETLVDARDLDGSDDEIIFCLPSSQRSECDVAHSPKYCSQDEHAPRGGNGHSPCIAAPGVVSRGFERFLEERRRLSPAFSPSPPLEGGRDAYASEYVAGAAAGASVNDPEPAWDKGPFDDFPVCEMSIAMGLHDRTRRRGNVIDQTSHGD
ncbi:hypothetical protein LshimejAT787_2600550 [Lyophyllum shimeji]|uniref:Uncharacterized protein n=1 Tax=Lyophyllum shimeji TaxID=47721 RepID=A0A9P3Q2P6_LYOSH|nr:hypothetical protein LshimejAT787_2600550 [Lyophyllum shimeji]